MGDKTFMKNAIQLINKFTQVPGLTPNVQKSTDIWLGPLRNGPNLCEGYILVQTVVHAGGKSYTNLKMSLVHGTTES